MTDTVDSTGASKSRRGTLSERDPRHGTINGYINLACRCAACREANRRQHADYISRLRAQGRTVGGHGTTASYECGCRCVDCTRANSAKARIRRQQRTVRPPRSS